MRTVQLAIANRRYADQIQELLVRDGDYSVEVVNTPNPTLDGVIVMDEDLVDNIAAYDPQRCVIIARKTPQKIASLFEQGVRQVVFDGDSPNTARLAILGAELRVMQANRLLRRHTA